MDTGYDEYDIEQTARLREFLAATDEILNFVLEYAETFFPDEFSTPDLISSTRVAWREVEPVLIDVRQRRWTDYEISRLATEGLLGNQGSFKLDVFDTYHSIYQARLHDWSPIQRAKDRFWRSVIKILRKILKVINAILDSFKEAFPGLGVVKEVKDSIENILEGHDLIQEELERPE